jgi:hypothetical protein
LIEKENVGAHTLHLPGAGVKRILATGLAGAHDVTKSATAKQDGMPIFADRSTPHREVRDQVSAINLTIAVSLAGDQYQATRRESIFTVRTPSRPGGKWAVNDFGGSSDPSN